MNWFIVVCVLLIALQSGSGQDQGQDDQQDDQQYDQQDDQQVDQQDDNLNRDRYDDEEGGRHRHRHRQRHRHRHRIYQQNLVEMELLKTDINEVMKDFEEDLNTLTDRLTIKEDVVEMATKNVTFPSSQVFAKILRSQHNSLSDITVNSKNLNKLEMKVLDSIVRTLTFYGSQLNEIEKDDTAISLKILKDIDDKHGRVLQNNFPLSQWIQSNCGGKDSDSEESICASMVRQWKNRSGGKSNANMEYWKPATVLQNYINAMDDNTIENIGNEKEGLWGKLNAQCQNALVSRCEIPYICERTLLDPTPRSQYLLTHQLFQRILIDNADCPNLRAFVTEEDTYTKLCTKAYMEAQYLDLLDVPINQRDLFAELVGFGGYLGYTNFLREDWLERILSWQSESDSGCFIEDPLTPIGLISTDMGFKRLATKTELEQGVNEPNEKCLPHLTAVALTALTAYWDYLMDLKNQQLVPGGRSEL